MADEFSQEELDTLFKFQGILWLLDKYWLEVDIESVEAEMPNHEMYTIRLDTIEEMKRRFTGIVRRKRSEHG